MSNILTRKSLAFGALVALASTAIAGTPAQAAGEVVFAPTSGTSYNTFLDASFSLTASLAPGQVAANISQLKYQIVGTATGDVSYKVNGGSLTATTAASQVISGSGSPTAQNTLELSLSSAVVAAAATYSATVTAFIDSNSNSVLDSGEFSQARTVSFKKDADVVPTVAITSNVLAGDTSVKATATYTDLNTEQLTAADFKVVFTTAGATSAGVTATSGVYTDTVTALVAAGTVSAQAKYKTRLLGTAVSKTVAARTIATVVGALVTGSDAAVISSVPTARLNTAFSVKATVKAAAVGSADPLPVAGVSVTAAVSAFGTLSTTRKLSINGTVYTANADVPASIALTSDANGEVKVNLLSTGFLTTEQVTVTFTSQNIVATAVTVTQAKTAYAITADNGNLYSTPKGTAKAITLSVKDQFGTLSAVTNDRIVVTPTIVSGLTAYGTLVTAYLPVVAGKATYTATSGAATAAGQLSLATALQNVDDATNNYQAYSPAVAGTAILVNVTTTADSFTTAPAATATAKVTADAFTDAIASASAYRADYSVVVANPGTAVTVAAPGAYINAGGTFGTGTVTVNTPANGTVAITVYAHTVGSLTVTFTNGVAVKTSVVTVTTDLAPAAVSLVTPAQAQVGQALDVVINVTDKWGNVVPTPTTGTNAGILSVSSTGSGYFASASPVANAAGKATVKYIVGTADIGTAYLSATLDLATDVTAAKSIEFGLTDADVVAGGHRVFVNSEFAKGRTLTVTIDGVRVYSKVQSTDNAVELAFTQKKAGAHTVTVRISGGIVFTEKVITN